MLSQTKICVCFRFNPIEGDNETHLTVQLHRLLTCPISPQTQGENIIPTPLIKNMFADYNIVYSSCSSNHNPLSRLLNITTQHPLLAVKRHICCISSPLMRFILYPARRYVEPFFCVVVCCTIFVFSRVVLPYGSDTLNIVKTDHSCRKCYCSS